MPLFGSLFRGTRPDDLGVVDGRLRPPPETPNCVHSQVDSGHPAHVDPFDATWEEVVTALMSHPEVTIVSQSDNYLHAEAQTRVMGFVDDLELVAGDGVVHVRSASRLGKGDMGKNRSRVEEIRAMLPPPGHTGEGQADGNNQ